MLRPGLYDLFYLWSFLNYWPNKANLWPHVWPYLDNNIKTNANIKQIRTIIVRPTNFCVEFGAGVRKQSPPLGQWKLIHSFLLAHASDMPTASNISLFDLNSLFSILSFGSIEIWTWTCLTPSSLLNNRQTWQKSDFNIITIFHKLKICTYGTVLSPLYSLIRDPVLLRAIWVTNLLKVQYLCYFWCNNIFIMNATKNISC